MILVLKTEWRPGEDLTVVQLTREGGWQAMNGKSYTLRCGKSYKQDEMGIHEGGHGGGMIYIICVRTGSS